MGDEEIQRLIGSRIRIARTACKLNQSELAKAIEVDKQTVSNWERGVKSPSAKNIVAIAHATNSDPNFLTGYSALLDVSDIEH